MRCFFDCLVLLTVALSLTAYFCVLIPPHWLWLSSLFALSIPIWGMLLLLFMGIYLLFKRYRKAFYILIILLLGTPFWRATLALSLPWQASKKQFSVLTYNVDNFSIYDYAETKRSEKSSALIRDVVGDDADIKCFQEYYSSPGDSIFDVTAQLEASGLSHHYIQNMGHPFWGGRFGMAIFSRYPIVAHGQVFYDAKKNNNAIYADLLIGNDTVRVYNVHLQSTHMDRQILQRLDNYHIWTYAFVLYQKSLDMRSRQVGKLAGHIQKSPYRSVVLCADLNDLPYSYSYFKLRTLLSSAFEDKGAGLGFTYNGNLPFLRIDHIFYRGLKLNQYKNLKNLKNSDHFPQKSVF
ncbi:MAG: endonuclease/exonuclease/phosphatase family protein [Bernardetiaceae bacterium]|nr:endonuclease/exonuclease/phosphatase family protein [Bernardetiaceae bacterium]